MAYTLPTSYSQAQTLYAANLDYDLAGSVDKAQQFVVACRYLIANTAESAARDFGSVSTRTQKFESALEKALTWIARQRTTGTVRYADFAGFHE
jgi:hypothetical protein